MRSLVFGMAGKVARALACALSSSATTVFLSRDEAGFTDSNSCVAAIFGSDAEAIVNAAARTAVDKAEPDDAMVGADSARVITAEAKLDCRINDKPSSHNPITARRPLSSRLDFADFDTNLGASRPNWRFGPTKPVEEFAR